MALPFEHGLQSTLFAARLSQRPRVAAVAAELDPDIRQLHWADYREPGRLLPGDVLHALPALSAA